MILNVLIVVGALYLVGLALTLFGSIMEYSIAYHQDEQRYWARMIMKSPFWPFTAYRALSRWIAGVAIDAYRSN